ncbi:NADH-quinone oxidoreductase subunit NuoN [Acidihalobacter ferrooxydans]|uniref:NADH-quinone oxidoreductase subunit N n=1 Tax=Acidihalobacter ferrooxydans TaxID=1765967 RepID=A0A1P8UJ61_9GAMM|nr:NADH-quinone oxidoreductase subunit NuoN [Acidihalobacter ferrooxydans]APZ43853.1 NADH-quinone oxidoreductase subunit N [Acidihalobacter ferrooxydans]
MTLPSANDFILIVPELFLLGMICAVLVIDVFLKDGQRNVTYWLTQFSLATTAALVLIFNPHARALAFAGTFVSDPMSVLLKLFVLVVTIAVFVYSRPYMRDRDLFRGEYYVLGLAGVLGMMVLISAHSLLTIYLGLELMSLALYAMVAFQRDSARASEAAMKYFVLGALASGLLLYGMSILYGLTGSLDISTIAAALVQSTHPPLAVGLAVAFIVAGVAFKLGAVPFHMWVPDVYEGAPTSVTLYIGSVTKIAAFAMVIRLLAEALPSAQIHWSGMLGLLVILSLAVGNIVAIAQRSIKRMLAYSTISHVGFVFMGVLAGTDNGYAAAMFYVLVYALMSAGAFGMIAVLSRKGFEAENLEDFRGLNQRNPWLAFIMLVLMFSMAGVPPTVGFYAKLVVLQAVVQVGQPWLALYAVIMSVIGAFYYLRAIKYVYFDKAEDETPLKPGLDVSVVMSINGLALLALGILPGLLMTYCALAAASL